MSQDFACDTLSTLPHIGSPDIEWLNRECLKTENTVYRSWKEHQMQHACLENILLDFISFDPFLTHQCPLYSLNVKIKTEIIKKLSRKY